MAFSPRTKRPPLRHCDLDALSDRDLEAILFDGTPPKPEGAKASSFFAWKTVGGAVVLLLACGVLLEGIGGVGASLLTFGLLFYFVTRGSWSCSSQNRSSSHRAAGSSQRLARSATDKKLAGVCGGLAAYFGVDVTLIRLALLVGLLATGGVPLILVYLLLACVLPSPPVCSPEERLRILRES